VNTFNVIEWSGATRMPMPDMRIHSRAKFLKISLAIACVFFVVAVALSPGPGSSLGMPWSWFYCTWGVMLFAATVTLVGFCICRLAGDRFGLFYAVCPSLLIIAFLVFYFLGDIVRVILRYEQVG
jgi:hypothetical protein